MADKKTPYSLAEVDDVKESLKVIDGDTSFDERIRRIISGVSTAIESHCGRTFAAREVSVGLRDGTGTDTMILEFPLIAVTALTNDTTVIAIATELAIYKPQGIIKLKDGVTFAAGPEKITISYRHGFDEIPSDIRLAAKDWAIHQFMLAERKRIGVSSQTMKDESASFVTATMPEEVRGLIEPYMVPSF